KTTLRAKGLPEFGNCRFSAIYRDFSVVSGGLPIRVGKNFPWKLNDLTSLGARGSRLLLNRLKAVLIDSQAGDFGLKGLTWNPEQRGRAGWTRYPASGLRQGSF